LKNTAVILFFCINSFLFSQTPFLHQGAFNGNLYEYGYKSSPKIDVIGFPSGLGNDKFKMLHDLFILPYLSITEAQVTKIFFLFK